MSCSLRTTHNCLSVCARVVLLCCCEHESSFLFYEFFEFFEFFAFFMFMFSVVRIYLLYFKFCFLPAGTQEIQVFSELCTASVSVGVHVYIRKRRCGYRPDLLGRRWLGHEVAILSTSRIMGCREGERVPSCLWCLGFVVAIKKLLINRDEDEDVEILCLCTEVRNRPFFFTSTFVRLFCSLAKIDGTSVRDAMEAWWAGRGSPAGQVALFDSCDDINCNPTCLTDALAGLRDETDSPFVWAIVFVTLAAAVGALGSGKLPLNGERVVRGANTEQADDKRVQLWKRRKSKESNLEHEDSLSVATSTERCARA